MYNLENKVTSCLSKVISVLNSINKSYEIILVNDGSDDNTLEVLQQLTHGNSTIKVISYDKNMGKGYAVKNGILNSVGENVIFLDGDMEISPTGINHVVKSLDSASLCIASKTHPMSRVNYPPLRHFLSRVFNLLVKISVGIRIDDTQSGLKAGKGEKLRFIFQNMTVKRYAFDVELLTIAKLLELRINEVPVNITLNRSFHLTEIARMFIDVMAIGYRLRIRKWYQQQIKHTNLHGCVDRPTSR
jgi:glycosyltransferase involved in cell wall biosynthesis